MLWESLDGESYVLSKWERNITWYKYKLKPAPNIRNLFTVIKLCWNHYKVKLWSVFGISCMRHNISSALAGDRLRKTHLRNRTIAASVTALQKNGQEIFVPNSSCSVFVRSLNKWASSHAGSYSGRCTAFSPLHLKSRQENSWGNAPRKNSAQEQTLPFRKYFASRCHISLEETKERLTPVKSRGSAGLAAPAGSSP